MARRNSERLQPHHEPNSDESPPPPAVNPSEGGNVFSFVTPTEFVELPSKGAHYNEDHPLRGADTIEIRHMTAKEEDILTSEALIRKGLALDRLLQAVIMDKSINVNDLLVGDKNAILIACRKTGYGSSYETTVVCPTCMTSAESVLDLDDLVIKESKNLPENVSENANGNYTIRFEDIDLNLEVRLLRGSDEKRVAQLRDNRKKRKLPSANITDQLVAIIVSINGMTEAAIIKQFVERVPAILSRQIRTIYDELTPDLDLSFEFECDECNYVGKVGMPLTADFFWPQS